MNKVALEYAEFSLNRAYNQLDKSLNGEDIIMNLKMAQAYLEQVNV